MVFGGRKCFEQPAGQVFSGRLPALLNRVEFGRVGQKLFESETRVVLFEKCSNEFSFVAWPAVNKKQDSLPAFQQFFCKLDEVALFFSFRETKNEIVFGASAKNVGVLVRMVYCYGWVASFFCPASCDKRDEAERGFVFAGHDKTFLPIVLCEAPGFFLNAFISSFDAVL